MGYRGTDYYYRSRAGSSDEYLNDIAEYNYQQLISLYGRDFADKYVRYNDVTKIDWFEVENYYRNSAGITVRELDLSDDYDKRLSDYYKYEGVVGEVDEPDITTVDEDLKNFPEGVDLFDIISKHVIPWLKGNPIDLPNRNLSDIVVATGEFFKDILRGDYASVDRKLSDYENLVTNLMLYLAGRGISRELLTKVGAGYYKWNAVLQEWEFVPDMTLMYQWSYVLKNQLSDMAWEGYSSKYTGRQYDFQSGVFRTPEGVEYTLRTWSYAKGGNTKDMPQSGGWMKSKYGDYYIRKNLY